MVVVAVVVGVAVAVVVVVAMTSAEQSTEIGWAIVELMGHRKLAGYVTDDNGLVRIDVYTKYKRLGEPRDLDDPDVPEPIATQWYGRAAIYCITASTMEMCLRLARSHQPAPVGRWELPAPESEPGAIADDGNGY